MIREYKPEDFERLFKLERACFSSRFRWTKAQFRKHINGKSVNLVDVSLTGDIMGFISLEKNYIATVDVDPDVWGCGIGSRLIHAAHDYMREQKHLTSRLNVYVKNPAIGLYTKLGYIPTKVVKNFYANGEHALEMTKEL